MSVLVVVVLYIFFFIIYLQFLINVAIINILRPKGQTMFYKTLHIKLKIEQHESH